MQRDITSLKSFLATVPKEGLGTTNIEIPMPNGTSEVFAIFNSPTMQEPLATAHPEIMTFTGQGITSPTSIIKLDVTPHGFHAMVLGNNDVYIDPITNGTDEYYICYYKKNFIAHPSKLNTPACGVKSENYDAIDRTGNTKQSLLDKVWKPTNKNSTAAKSGARSGASAQLRTYVAAISTTGEYTAFHGGTKPLALAAINTTVNRINGVYEREFAARFILVSTNSNIIYTNAGTDPFTNGSSGALIGENQSTVNSVIGSSNYDIGHNFSTGGGGLANFECVCKNSSKARGITGNAAPVGDPFDIDYVAHEIGHQFGGSHSFNGNSGSCSGGNRNGPTAYEPGSGSTIMAYAGICGADNIANRSDDYFHRISLNQMGSYMTSGTGNSCPTKTTLTNTAPSISSVTPSTYTIPINTPFTVSGVASDANGDAITYCWEQGNLGSAGDPDMPSGDAPILRSFDPTVDSFRHFPQISDIVNNFSTLGEILPSYTRTLDFVLTVRDNRAGGGCETSQSMSVDVNSSAGPFVVTSPNTSGISWAALSTQTVTWNVAGTNSSPVNCSQVNIYMSTDGGYTFPHVVATGMPNTGSASVTIPNLPGNNRRIKVAGANNIFWDMSNSNFTVTPANLTADFTANTTSFCEGGVVTFTNTSFGGTATSVTWNFPGGTPSSSTAPNPPAITYSTAGSYFVSLNISNGGTSDSELKNSYINVTAQPTAVVTASALNVTTGTMISFNSSGSSAGGAYSWALGDGSTSSSTNPTHTFFTAGTYTAVLTINDGGCVGKDSVTITVTNPMTTGIDGIESTKINVYPNPSNGVFNISIDSDVNLSGAQVKIYNAIGKLVEQMPLEVSNNTSMVDLSLLSEGIYHMSIISNEEVIYNGKLLKSN